MSGLSENSPPSSLIRDLEELRSPDPSVQWGASVRLKKHERFIAFPSSEWSELLGYVERWRNQIGRGLRHEDEAYTNVFGLLWNVLHPTPKPNHAQSDPWIVRLLSLSRALAEDRPLDLNIRRYGFFVVGDFGSEEDLKHQFDLFDTWPAPPPGDQNDRKTHQTCIHDLLRRHGSMAFVTEMELVVAGIRRKDPNRESLVYLDQMVEYARSQPWHS